MAEYIEREAAKKEFSLNFGGVSHAVIANRLLDAIPSADVVEVKHGRWVETYDGWYYLYSCSECGAEALTKDGTMHDQICSTYCPNCGARMDGADNG